MGSNKETQSDSKKRCVDELDDSRGVSCKLMRKIQDLALVSKSQETGSLDFRDKKACAKSHFGEEMAQLPDVPITLEFDDPHIDITGTNSSSGKVNPVHINLNLHIKAFASRGSPGSCEKSDDMCLLKAHATLQDKKCPSTEGLGLDLNASDVGSSINRDPFYPYKNYNELKSRDMSECGSTTGHPEDGDWSKVWKDMKQNGFLSLSQRSISSSHGGIPMPKQHGRNIRNGSRKKHSDLVKREQIGRFAKIADPSGLLNGLNPGILNHVRNKKQVHSIIEALVNSEKADKNTNEGKQTSRVIGGAVETDGGDGVLGINPFSFSDGNASSTLLYGMKKRESYVKTNREVDFDIVGRIFDSVPARHSTSGTQDDDVLALKLSTSSVKACEESTAFSNEDLQSEAHVASLSLQGARVASQWLELLHNDIKGRISALRCSRKRVQAVIATELPFLLSKEFSSNQDQESCMVMNAHKARWTSLFDQMDNALSYEEKQLESFLNQVTEMQLQRDQGLKNLYWDPSFDFKQQGPLKKHARYTFDIGFPPQIRVVRSRFSNVENAAKFGLLYIQAQIFLNWGRCGHRTLNADTAMKEMAIQAAAASMYSTCNYLMSKENVSCC